MTFTSFSFLLFFPTVVLIFYVLPQRARRLWLIISSYAFYMSWNAAYALLLVAVTIVTFLLGLAIEDNNTKEKYKKIGIFVLGVALISTLLLSLRYPFILIAVAVILYSLGIRNKLGKENDNSSIFGKVYVIIGVLVLVGSLFFFKYDKFVVTVVNKLNSLIHFSICLTAIDIIMPVGISFFTFQAIGYIIDVYRKKIKAERDFLTYALFISFFPQIVSGPIGRAPDLLPQYHTLKRFDYDRFSEGLYKILYGFFLKLVVSDRIGLFVDNVYKDFHLHSGAISLFAIILYAFQIYTDFNGYSLTAVGVARILGIDLVENFNAPYLSKSVREFWRRWHISLSTWFRDYLYFPLGGSRCKLLRHLSNIMIVFLVSGLWHGANWTFIIWGGIHGIYQIIEIIFEKLKGKHNSKRIIWKLLRTTSTFFAVTVAWVFFRMPDVGSATQIITHTVTDFRFSALFDSTFFTLGLNMKNWIVLLLSLLLVITFDICKYHRIDIIGRIRRKNLIFRDAVIIVSILVIALLGIWGGNYDAGNFIYTQF